MPISVSHPSIHPSISTLLENDEKLDGRYTVLTIIDRVPSFVMQAWFNKYVPGDHCTPMLSKEPFSVGVRLQIPWSLPSSYPCAPCCVVPGVQGESFWFRCPKKQNLNKFDGTLLRLLSPVWFRSGGVLQIDFKICAILNLGLSSNATFK